ncbi:hypothetical protein GW17_00034074 [Ensete ventricosum]|nr:hypothetical protein GW17_00034074 [Ensete ventricosum]
MTGEKGLTAVRLGEGFLLDGREGILRKRALGEGLNPRPLTEARLKAAAPFSTFLRWDRGVGPKEMQAAELIGFSVSPLFRSSFLATQRRETVFDACDLGETGYDLTHLPDSTLESKVGGHHHRGGERHRRGRAHGAIVVIPDVRDELGTRVAAAIGLDKCSYRHSDVTKEEDVEETVAKVMRAHGRLDVMFSDAGGPRPDDVDL